MKILFDFLPVLVFFVSYKWLGLFYATAVAMLAATAQVSFTWLANRKIESMHLYNLVIIVVLGSATLWLQNEWYIKWKPSVINWIIASVFLFSQWLGKQTMVEKMMGKHMSLPSFIWRRLNLGWSFFFLTLGFLNLYVIYHFNTDTWVNFKLFGILGLTVIFVILQAMYLAHHLPPQEKSEYSKR